MKMLGTVDHGAHPLNNVLSVTNTPKITPKRDLKDDYSVIVVKGTDAKQGGDNLSGR